MIQAVGVGWRGVLDECETKEDYDRISGRSIQGLCTNSDVPATWTRGESRQAADMDNSSLRTGGPGLWQGSSRKRKRGRGAGARSTEGKTRQDARRAFRKRANGGYSARGGKSFQVVAIELSSHHPSGYKTQCRWYRPPPTSPCVLAVPPGRPDIYFKSRFLGTSLFAAADRTDGIYTPDH